MVVSSAGAVRNTRKNKSLFLLKDRTEHKSYVIYEGTCSCGNSYIGETIRNANVRWDEHNPINGNSEPSKHLLIIPYGKY